MFVKTREYQYDNVRFLLIACVVFGHFLENARGIPYQNELYRLIYSFHMPAFLFLSGMFARFNRQKLLTSLFFPYMVLQVAYTYFSKWLYNPDIHLRFSQPQWLLWYLFALIVYNILLPFYDTPNRYKRMVLVVGAFALAILVGFDKSIGYDWNASRIFVFQPWFMLGFYFRKSPHIIEKWRQLKVQKKICIAFLLLLGCVIAENALLRSEMTGKMLYGAQGYQELDFTWKMRLLSFCCAGFVIALILVLAETCLKRKIPIITMLGENTLPIYLFHGFVVYLVQYKYNYLLQGPLRIALLCISIFLVLGNPWVSKGVHFLLGGGWYSLLRKRYARAV